MTKLSSDLLRLCLLPYTDAARGGVNLGRVGEYRALKTALNDAVVLDVFVREHSNKGYGQYCENAQRETEHRIMPPAAMACILAMRNSEFDSHNELPERPPMR